MKLFFFFLSLFIFSLLASDVVLGQQQGLGIVFNESPFIGKKINTTKDHPIVQIPPICGNKRRSEGFRLAYPFGAGIHGFWYEQDYTASNLLISDSTGYVTVTADTMYQDTRASELKVTIRPDVWLFPFLNVYGLFGYTQGKVSPNISVPSFTMHLPGGIDFPIDTIIELNETLTYFGPTVGVGVTFAMGFDAFFVVIDYNYSETYPNDHDGKLTNHEFSPKFGIQLSSKKGNGRGALWVGSMYYLNDQSFEDMMNVEEISPEVALILGEEAAYSGDIASKQKWNVLIGGAYYINNHHNLFLELGFFGRQQAKFGYGFRF